MEHDLGDYERAMDEALAEMGVERPIVTIADLELADKADLVNDLAERQRAWGDYFAEVLRTAKGVKDSDFVDASTDIDRARNVLRLRSQPRPTTE